MNQGPKFLLGTVVDTPKKFHDPESIFWVSNNNFEKTVGPEIAKFGDLSPSFKMKSKKKLKYGPKILHAHIIEPNFVKNFCGKTTSGYPNKEQGRIHSNSVVDGWAGAVTQKTLGIQKCDRPTYQPTN